MKISVICHGNIARSQILHHYLKKHADQASLSLDIFSCGTATENAYPNADYLLSQVQEQLHERGLNVEVKRNVFDAESIDEIVSSDLILVADMDRKKEVLNRLQNHVSREKILLFYEFIGEGEKNFMDTYDPVEGAQNPTRFNSCFDELERIAELVIQKIVP